MTTQDAVEAGDSTLTAPRLDALRARLDQLAQERLAKEMSDDFAYTNGSIRRISAQMAEVRAEIEALSAAA